MDEEKGFMKLAIEEAKRSISKKGKTPLYVGAVIVKNGEILDKAYRGEISEGEHAEYTLLERKLSNIDLSGATLYTTLEPCTERSHSKSPCAKRIVQRRIDRVVIGIVDPNPVIRGNGVWSLTDNKIKVDHFPDELQEEIRTQNLEFIEEQREKKGPKPEPKEEKSKMEQKVEDEKPQPQATRICLPLWPEEITSARKSREVIALFTDIRGFTDFVQIRAGDRQVGELMDRYYHGTCQAIQKHEGWINKYLGDGLMALWFVSEDAPEETVNKSMLAALEIQKKFKDLRESRKNYEGLGIGISLNMGSPLVGRFGFPPHHDYTAICRPINIASRLVQEARDQILVTEEIMRNTSENFHSLKTEPRRFKGIEDEITPYWILGEKKDFEVTACSSCAHSNFCMEKLQLGKEEKEKRVLLCVDCWKCAKTKDCLRKAGRNKRNEDQLCCWECSHYVKCMLSWYRGYNGHDTLIPCTPSPRVPLTQ